MASDAKPEPTIGFLTVVEHDQHGLMGGYLVLNAAGRPLEFHCTAPLKSNRAQQILYGPTLEPFLYGEQIGATLVRKSGLMPLAVFVDRPPALAVRPHIEAPAALVVGSDAAALRNGIEFSIAGARLNVAARHAADRESIQSRLTALDDLFDLAEPFSRIR